VAWARLILGMALVPAGSRGHRGYSLLIVLLQRWELWLPVQISIYLFCILSIFSFLAGATYERATNLARPMGVAERTAALLHKQDLHRSEAEVTAAYGLTAPVPTFGLGNVAGLVGEARSRARRLPLALRARRPWDDPRYVTRLTQEHVDRLLLLKRAGEALDTWRAGLN